MLFKFRGYSLLLFFFMPLATKAQSWNFSVGANVTDYQFTNSLGNMTNFLKPSSGLHVQLMREQKIWDWERRNARSNYILQLTDRKYGKGRFFSLFKYAFALNYNQFNSIGGYSTNLLNYQTDWLGGSFGLGPEIPILGGLVLSGKGIFSVQKMIVGNQLVNNQYMSLGKDPQFSIERIFTGYSLSLIQQVNANVSVFVNYQEMSTIKVPDYPVRHLRLIPATISLGVSLNK